MIVQYIGVVLIASGCLLTLITSYGLLRMSGLFSRMHAATKPQVLGVILLCSGLSLVMADMRVSATMALVIIFQLIAAPISAQMLGRAAYRTKLMKRSTIIVDEYAEDLERAQQEDNASKA